MVLPVSATTWQLAVTAFHDDTGFIDILVSTLGKEFKRKR